MDIVDRIRSFEEKKATLFSVKKPFSEHLMKWEDATLPDKYDHNCFEYSDQPSREEFEKAVAYQKEIGAGFIKLEGDSPLEDAFGLESGITLTMAFTKKETDWKKNKDISIRPPLIPELEEIDVKHFGPIYGEDFSRRNIRCQYKKLEFHGAYLLDKLVGACYSFRADGITCIDGLIVDDAHRHQYVATTLLKYIREKHSQDILILHADNDDTPKDMYLKMGFIIVDRLYEYSKTDMSS